MTKKQKRGDEGVIRNRSDGEGGGIVGGAPWLPENQKKPSLNNRTHKP